MSDWSINQLSDNSRRLKSPKSSIGWRWSMTLGEDSMTSSWCLPLDCVMPFPHFVLLLRIQWRRFWTFEFWWNSACHQCVAIFGLKRGTFSRPRNLSGTSNSWTFVQASQLVGRWCELVSGCLKISWMENLVIISWVLEEKGVVVSQFDPCYWLLKKV